MDTEIMCECRIFSKGGKRHDSLYLYRGSNNLPDYFVDDIAKRAFKKSDVAFDGIQLYEELPWIS